MSLDKSILYGKEHRKQYIGAKAIDRTCRNHGSCAWCMGNRMYRHNKKIMKASQEFKEYICGFSSELV